MYIYIYIYIYIYECSKVCVCVDTEMKSPGDVCICVYVCVCVCVCVCEYTIKSLGHVYWINTHMNIHTHTCTHKRIDAYTNEHTDREDQPCILMHNLVFQYACVYIRTNTHTYMHTYIQECTYPMLPEDIHVSAKAEKHAVGLGKINLCSGLCMQEGELSGSPKGDSHSDVLVLCALRIKCC